MIQEKISKKTTGPSVSRNMRPSGPRTLIDSRLSFAEQSPASATQANVSNRNCSAVRYIFVPRLLGCHPAEIGSRKNKSTRRAAAREVPPLIQTYDSAAAIFSVTTSKLECHQENDKRKRMRIRSLASGFRWA